MGRRARARGPRGDAASNDARRLPGEAGDTTVREPRGPGLARARVRPVRDRTVRFLSLSEGYFRDALDAADVVSEGAVVDGDRYYGTTSMRFSCSDGEASGEPAVSPPASLDDLAYALSRDPHVRVRALRVARREAEARAGTNLATLQAEVEVFVRPREGGSREPIEAEVRVDLAAPLLAGVRSRER